LSGSGFETGFTLLNHRGNGGARGALARRRDALDRRQQHLGDVEHLDLFAGVACRLLRGVRPSDSITRQNGQPTAIWSAPVATASRVRFSLIRDPMVSSIHIRAPPAPQQKDRSPERSISTYEAPGKT
jgi:hypothetical protein